MEVSLGTQLVITYKVVSETAFASNTSRTPRPLLLQFEVASLAGHSETGDPIEAGIVRDVGESHSLCP